MILSTILNVKINEVDEAPKHLDQDNLNLTLNSEQSIISEITDRQSRVSNVILFNLQESNAVHINGS